MNNGELQKHTAVQNTRRLELTVAKHHRAVSWSDNTPSVDVRSHCAQASQCSVLKLLACSIYATALTWPPSGAKRVLEAVPFCPSHIQTCVHKPKHVCKCQTEPDRRVGEQWVLVECERNGAILCFFFLSSVCPSCPPCTLDA